MNLWGALRRRKWDSRRGTYKQAGGVAVHIPEMGGDVRVRGLTPQESYETMALALSNDKEIQPAILLARLLGYGVIDPAIGHENVPAFIGKHPLIAIRLADRIRELSVQSLRQAGLIQD
jgi:hypothetical protein